MRERHSQRIRHQGALAVVAHCETPGSPQAKPPHPLRGRSRWASIASCSIAVSMPEPRCSPTSPVAILSFHSHSDRSFLDDRELALLSGDLSAGGIENDLVLVVIDPSVQDDGESDIEAKLVDTLRRFDPIVYERVWSPELVARLRSKLSGKTFIGLRGEHELMDSAPADIFCNSQPRQILPPLVRWLRGESESPPTHALFRHSRNGSGKAQWVQPESAVEAPASATDYAPNLRPLVVNPELLPEGRTFSVTGNGGCPFQNDARENPIYAGTNIPDQFGRGCAFCTTGNKYEGHPNAETAESVLEQIRYVHHNAPELRLLVLKDQNPFGYLTEVVERCEAEGLSGFTILLETRAEWFLRNAARFDRALDIARKIDVKLAPFLVGIENFSQPELDRFNKGISAESNIEFLDTLWKWKENYGDAFDLDHAAFGFILFSPWTTMEDLETNLAAIRRTNLDKLRGSLLLARARLYPDTALYYLAERDGLLVDDFASEGDDASKRYGYYPSHPWKHVHAEVAHFAALATAVTERNHSRDVVNLFQALLDAFKAAGGKWSALTAEDVWHRYQGESVDAARASEPMAPATEAFRERFARLIQPLPFDGTFADGWHIAELRTRPGRVEIELEHGREPKLVVELVPRGGGPHFRRSRHYEIRAAGRDFSGAQTGALSALAEAIQSNDA